MSSVSVELPAVPQTPAVATILGADADARGRLTALLADGGFDVASGPGQDAGVLEPSTSPADLVVLLCEGTDADRVRHVREAAEQHPHALILAVMPADTLNASMRRALLAGAAGITLDDEVDRALVATARALLAGQLTVPSVLSRQIAPRPLSHREKQILQLVVLGFTNREIAQRLFVAESTVKTHLSSAFRKIDARSRSEAVARIQDPDGGYGMHILDVHDGAVGALGAGVTD